MASFNELWRSSQTFRQLFLHTKVFDVSRKFDVPRAEALWWERWPKVEWGFCPAEGCTALVAVGEQCAKHGKCLPTWKWKNGMLYRYMKTHVNKQGKLISGKGDEWQYREYARYQAEKAYGPLPNGYVPAQLDSNPFNLRTANMIVVSKVAMLAIEAKLIKPSQAIDMDDALSVFWDRVTRRGRPTVQWAYNFDNIAKAAGVKVTRVRQAASRGQLDPGDLASIVEFCNYIKRSDSRTMSAG